MPVIKPLTGDDLTIEDVIKVATTQELDAISIDPKVFAACKKSQQIIFEKANDGKVIYGVTTGFGSNADKVIRPNEEIEITLADNTKKKVKKLEQLQVNLLRSHSTGIGENFSEEIVRAIMLIRLNTLLKGYSGIQEKTINTLKDFINKRVHPVIPQQGSVGASGDLCPLSHMALPLIGESYVIYQGQTMPSEEFFARYAPALGIEKATLTYKEGIALNNGTSVMTAVGCFAITEAEEILNVVLLTSSLFFEALCARKDFYDYEPIHKIRRHAGQQDIASAFRKILKGSTYVDLFAKEFGKLDENNPIEKVIKDIISKQGLNENDESKKNVISFLKKKSKPQDSYSIRCSPQVFGATLHAIRHVRSVVENELNAAVDNPLIFPDDDKIVSAGNFHGQPVALVMDYLKVAVAEIGNIVERQINKLVDPATNDCLPAFLIKEEGLNSGLMISQYAAASLVSENKVLAHPASVDSIPTSANTEDHVSMGTIAARQALQITGNVKKIMAIALLTAHHAFMIRDEQLKKCGVKNLSQASATKKLYEQIKNVIPALKDAKALEADRFLYDDLHAILNNWQSFVAVAGNNLGTEEK